MEGLPGCIESGGPLLFCGQEIRDDQSSILVILDLDEAIEKRRW